MSPDSASAHVTGLLGLPQPVPGAISLWESRAVLESGAAWRVHYNTLTRLATVLDENGEPLGWTEQAARGIRQVVLPGGVKPQVFFEDKFFGRRIWIGDTAHKAVMMLEGRRRVFGDDRIRLEHRDFANEVRFRCAPELLVPGVLVAFEVYARGSGNFHRQ